MIFYQPQYATPPPRPRSKNLDADILATKRATGDLQVSKESNFQGLFRFLKKEGFMDFIWISGYISGPGAEKTKTFQVADCFCKNFPGEKKRVQSCLRQFATNARKSVSCIRFLCIYNEAHYYSEVFHLIKGACKAGQIESLESFYCILENSQPALTEGLMVWKISGWYGKFPDGMESFQMVWIDFRWYGQFPDGLESFQLVWTVSMWSEQLPDGLENFQMVWYVSRWSGNLQCL